MQLKHLAPLAALLAAVSAQDGNVPTLTDALAGTEELSTLTSLVTADPELLAALGSASDITIMAPSNAAFEAALAMPEISQAVAADPGLIRAILQYHVLAGVFAAADIPESKTFVASLLNDTTYANVTGGQVVGVMREGEGVTVYSGAGAESTVTTADVFFQGGVVHIIDSVLTLPMSISATATAAGLTSLAEALTTADLVATVDGLVDVTVFAPTNAAFEAIADTAAGLSPEELASILTYHVVQGTVGYSTALTDGMMVETVNGAEVAIRVEGSNVFVNDIAVSMADVLVANGVVHVIDGVLIPDSDSDSAPTPTSTDAGAEETASSTTAPVQQATVAGAPRMATVGAAALCVAGVALLNM